MGGGGQSSWEITNNFGFVKDSIINISIYTSVLGNLYTDNTLEIMCIINPIWLGVLIRPILGGGADSAPHPPPSSFCNEVFGGFDETTFKQYITVGSMQKETVISSKLRTLSPFEILEKNPVATNV